MLSTGRELFFKSDYGQSLGCQSGCKKKNLPVKHCISDLKYTREEGGNQRAKSHLECHPNTRRTTT